MRIFRNRRSDQGAPAQNAGRVVVDCSSSGLAGYVERLVLQAGDSAEGVGYASFSHEGKECGVEIYVSPRREFYATIDIDLARTGMSEAALRQMVETAPAPHGADSLGPALLQLRFYERSLFELTLLELLRRSCPCLDEQVEVTEWWT